MGAAESRRAAAADEDDAAAIADNGHHARLVRVPGSLAGDQAELHVAVAALVSQIGGPLACAEDRGGVELEVRASRIDCFDPDVAGRHRPSPTPTDPHFIYMFAHFSFIYTQLSHIAQESTWDCGIACVQMVLTFAYSLLPPEVGQEAMHGWVNDRPARPPSMRDRRPDPDLTRLRQVKEEDVGRAALLAKVDTESIWTIDLLFLLQVRRGLRD